MLSQKAIQEFREIYQSEFGKVLPFDEATIEAERLLRLYKTVFKSDHNGAPYDPVENSSSTKQ